jgi:CubicO group peptidase (beta-lactamase class C family)
MPQALAGAPDAPPPGPATRRIAAGAPGRSLGPDGARGEPRAVSDVVVSQLVVRDVAVRDVLVPAAGPDAAARPVGAVLDDSFTDAWVVLQDGVIVDEWYAAASGPDVRHPVMSVTKSLVGCVTGILVEAGRLALDDRVEVHVPELAATAWAGATVAQLLDMRSGVRFVEDYADPDSDVRRLDAWLGALPPPGGPAHGLYAFLLTLHAGDPHGGPFRYRSAETDALGWVCERASGAPMADLLADLLWTPMGAERDAEMICDRTGTAVHDGGLCATARDLARFGRLLLDGGSVARDGGPAQVVPGTWLRGAWAVDADSRAAFLASPAELSFPGGWYRRQFWFRPGSYGDVLMCLGIHGQLVHVSRRTRTVCVKLSSWPTAQSPAVLQETLRACDAVGGALAGLAGRTDRHRLPGVVSGLSRRPRPSSRGSVI